jgi:hypothetical protein
MSQDNDDDHLRAAEKVDRVGSPREVNLGGLPTSNSVRSLSSHQQAPREVILGGSSISYPLPTPSGQETPREVPDGVDLEALAPVTSGPVYSAFSTSKKRYM